MFKYRREMMIKYDYLPIFNKEKISELLNDYNSIVCLYILFKQFCHWVFHQIAFNIYNMLTSWKYLIINPKKPNMLKMPCSQNILRWKVNISDPITEMSLVYHRYCISVHLSYSSSLFLLDISILMVHRLA